MLERLYEQLDAKYEELYQAEDEREELREDLEQAYNEVVAKRIKMSEYDSYIRRIKDDIKRINKDFDLYAGT